MSLTLIDTYQWNDNEIKPSFGANDITILEYREYIFYITITKCVIYLITAIFMYLELRNINTEIKSSPLLHIDDLLTEEIYQNIIEQSKFPNNVKLIQDYNNMININKSSSTNSESIVNI